MKTKVTISQDHWDRAQAEYKEMAPYTSPSICDVCPVARALHDAGFTDARVFPNDTKIGRNYVELPEAAKAVVKIFDNWHKVGDPVPEFPVEFEIEVRS